ncbi:MAG: M20/M25/M40 family metallo-hydrolase [Clostridia bacterium]|nr:M20/M25/M40 family metallo-hydrolase [Clostridia bacterium]
MAINQAMEQYAKDCVEETKKLVRDMCVIPAPSHHEQKRVAFVKDWMEKNGAEGVYVDDALNVIWPCNVTEDNDLIVFMAHTDVVFPDTEPLPFHEADGNYYCPGAGDDTANLANLLIAARYFVQNGFTPKTGMLFVANSCEEGLGNLKGSRKIIDTFGSRVKELITIDGNLGTVLNRAVGSHRYRVSVRTEGGHSYGAFGNRNAIRCLASLIDTLYSVKVPQNGDSKTTYNVGTISGGTSVNTIAQEAQMLYEYRSDDKECLEKMKVMFEKVVEAYRATGIEVDVELLGERPCGGELDPVAYNALLERAAKSMKDIVGVEAVYRPGSTDANYPLSKGIPAICVGGSNSYGCHTREEYLVVDSLYVGSRFLLDFMSNYFEV